MSSAVKSSVRTSLQIREVRHLALELGVAVDALLELAKDVSTHYRQFELKSKSGKVRKIASPVGLLRRVQCGLNSILQDLSHPDYVYGGRRGRSHFDNADLHTCQPMLLKSDLQDFFPSVGFKRVYTVFNARLQCSPNVARLLTRLTTVNGCLPTGAPTSTMLATLAAESLFARLYQLAESHGARFSVFVDDISISGPVHLQRLKPLVVRIIQQAGFKASVKKTTSVSNSEIQTVTGIRVDHGRDVHPEKLEVAQSLVARLEDAIEQGRIVTPQEFERAKATLAYIGACNYGAARPLTQRLRRLRGTRSNNNARTRTNVD